MNIDDLKGLELPVKIKNKRSGIETITSFNTSGMLIIDTDGEDDYVSIDYLDFCELAPKTKTIEVDEFLLILSDGTMIFNRQYLDARIVIDTIHIKRTYEICEETNNIIDMKEG